MLSPTRKLIVGSFDLSSFIALVMICIVMSASERAVSMDIVTRRTNDRVCEVLIGLTNNGPAMALYGYSVTNPTYFYVHGTAPAKTNSPFWCGTGMSAHTLRRGNGVQFLVSFVATNMPDALVVQYTQPSMWEPLYSKLPPAMASFWNRKPRTHATYVTLRENL